MKTLRTKLTKEQERIAYFNSMRSELFTTRSSGKEAYDELLDSIARIRDPSSKAECVINLHIMLNSFATELLGLEGGLEEKSLKLLARDKSLDLKGKAAHGNRRSYKEPEGEGA